MHHFFVQVEFTQRRSTMEPRKSPRDGPVPAGPGLQRGRRANRPIKVWLPYISARIPRGRPIPSPARAATLDIPIRYIQIHRIPFRYIQTYHILIRMTKGRNNCVVEGWRPWALQEELLLELLQVPIGQNSFRQTSPRSLPEMRERDSEQDPCLPGLWTG